MQAHSIRRSKHLELQELAAGVFAAIATEGGAAISNSGVIDLGNRTLVFDTFLTPQAALDLRVSIEQAIGQNLMSEYVEHCLTTAQRLVTGGEGGTEKSAALDMPEIYQSWHLAQFYPGNIHALMQRFSAAQ